ncbi:hypothetical protein FKM82_016509 [Ascaphus truei]
MEYASQGDLYDYISERQRLSEQEARTFFRQIVSAVQYCHANGIVHRDLKLENILLDENKNVKIADFGLSNIYHSDRYLQTYCGSLLYASPEIVNGKPYVGPEVDSWSLGVLLYILVHGSMPFDEQNHKKLVAQISCGAYKEPSRLSDASGLIRWLLMVNPERRASLSEVASHWWVNWGYRQPLSEPCKDSETPFSTVGGWLRRSSRPLWDNGSKVRCFLRQHLPGTTVARQCSLKRSKRENDMSRGVGFQGAQEKSPAVPPAPKKGILKNTQQCKSGYHSSPEHSEGTDQEGLVGSPPSLLPADSGVTQPCPSASGENQEPTTNGVRKGILKRNGKFSSAWAAPDLSFGALDCTLGDDKELAYPLTRERAPSSVSQESILSTESFELLDLPGGYRERAKGRARTRTMRGSVSAEDLLRLDRGEKGERTRLWDMSCYRGRVAESCLYLAAAEEEVKQVYRSAVSIGRELS